MAMIKVWGKAVSFILGAALLLAVVSFLFAQSGPGPSSGGGGGAGGGGSGSIVTTFVPNLNYANLTATGSSASVALPTGFAVLFQNAGTTAISCTLGIGSATATASENLIQPGGAFAMVVGANTFGACIDQTGTASNLVALSGGTLQDHTDLTAPIPSQSPAVPIGGVAICDGANGATNPCTTAATVKAVSTAPVTATDKALVVGLRPDSPGIVALGPATPANSIPTVSAGFIFGNMTTATTTTFKSGAGVLHTITIGTLGTVASSVSIFDNTAGSGTSIGILNSLTTGEGTYTFDVAFATGLTITTTGTVAPNITVSYR
jgi:hypothetical protein